MTYGNQLLVLPQDAGMPCKPASRMLSGGISRCRNDDPESRADSTQHRAKEIVEAPGQQCPVRKISQTYQQVGGCPRPNRASLAASSMNDQKGTPGNPAKSFMRHQSRAPAGGFTQAANGRAFDLGIHQGTPSSHPRPIWVEPLPDKIRSSHTQGEPTTGWRTFSVLMTWITSGQQAPLLCSIFMSLFSGVNFHPTVHFRQTVPRTDQRFHPQCQCRFGEKSTSLNDLTHLLEDGSRPPRFRGGRVSPKNYLGDAALQDAYTGPIWGPKSFPNTAIHRGSLGVQSQLRLRKLIRT